MRDKNSREFSIYLGLRVEHGVGPDKKALGMFCCIGHALVWAWPFDLGCVVLICDVHNVNLMQWHDDTRYAA